MTMYDTMEAQPPPAVSATKPWPVPMILAMGVAGMSLFDVVGLALSYLGSGLLNRGDWSGLGIFFGMIYLVPALVTGGGVGLMLARFRWSRAIYTVIVAIWVWIWAEWTFVAIDKMGAPVTSSTIGLVISVILVWLPGNKPFFCRSPRAAETTIMSDESR